MTEHFSQLKGRPRVFISYARTDGEQFARAKKVLIQVTYA